MWFIELGANCVTVAVVVRVWWLVVQVLRARNKRRLLSRMFGVVSDSPDFIGISAICHDIDSPFPRWPTCSMWSMPVTNCWW